MLDSPPNAPCDARLWALRGQPLGRMDFSARTASRAGGDTLQVNLHANATTTPKQREYIQESDKPVKDLAEELSVSETTVRRWKKRDHVRDRSS